MKYVSPLPFLTDHVEPVTPKTRSYDPELDTLVRKIFEIIPSYDDEDRLDAVRRLVEEYVIRKLRQSTVK